MIHTQFIVTTSICVTASLSFGVLLSSPSFLDTVEAYERTDVSQNTSLDIAEVAVSPQEDPSEEVTAPIVDEEATSSFEAEHEEHTDTANNTEVAVAEEAEIETKTFSVPFYSQFEDITSASWKKVGCGIASLAMLIEFHKPGKLTSVDTLLQEGIDKNAYLSNAGWTYAGLISVSEKYGLTGKTHDYGGSSMETAYDQFSKSLAQGPVMASVHYTFEPTNPIPHLVIINGIHDGMVSYNDPAEKNGGGSITEEKFKNSWKKRYIEFYPAS